MRFLALSAILALAVGCSGSSFKGSSDAAPPQASERGSGKTSDDSEGVPGYLVDPERIEARLPQKGRLQITAPEGTVVASGGGAPEGLVVHAWRVLTEDYEAARLAGGGVLVMQGRLLATIAVDDAGRFRETLDAPGEDDTVILTVGRAGVTPSLRIPSARDGRYPAAAFDGDDDEGVFEGVAASGESDALARFDMAKLTDVPLLARYAMRGCLVELFGPDVDRAKLGPYRRVDLSALIARGRDVQEEAGKGPELVHVVLNAVALSGVTLTLTNPDATYCLDVNAVLVTSTTFKVPCDAAVNDTRRTLLSKGLEIQKAGC